MALLLDSKADYASSDANGATPLHYAAQNNLAVSRMIQPYNTIQFQCLSHSMAFEWSESMSQRVICGWTEGALYKTTVIIISVC